MFAKLHLFSQDVPEKSKGLRWQKHPYLGMAGALLKGPAVFDWSERQRTELEVNVEPPEGLPSEGLPSEGSQPPGDEWTPDKIRIRPSRETKKLMIRANVLSVTGNVRLCIGVAGDVTEAEIMKTTGYDDYDKRLLHAVRRWTYRPYRILDRAIRVCGKVAFHYEIK